MRYGNMIADNYDELVQFIRENYKSGVRFNIKVNGDGSANITLPKNPGRKKNQDS